MFTVPRLLVKLLWILLGAITIYLSNMHKHIANWRQDLDHFSCYFLASTVTVGLVTSAYLVLHVKRIHGPKAYARWKTFAPTAVPILSGSQVLAFVGATRLFYPIYGHWTLPIVTVLSVSWINLLTFI